MHQLDTGHVGTSYDATHMVTAQGSKKPIKEVDEGFTSQQPLIVSDVSDISSPSQPPDEKLSDEVKKVLNEMNDIAMSIHGIMEEDDLDSLTQEYTKVETYETNELHHPNRR